MAFINLKALPSANTFHCFLREKTVYFSDEVFSLRFRGYFKQQCAFGYTDKDIVLLTNIEDVSAEVKI